MRTKQVHPETYEWRALDAESESPGPGGVSRRLFLSSLLAAPLTGAQAVRPNIIWIWCDNLAYQDLGIYGSQRVKTPVIDGLANSGVRFMQYYISHTVCSPSRAALLTGRQPFRAGVVDVLRPDGPSGLPADEITLGRALNGMGYATMAVGKWHLGDRRPFLPTNHGFQHYFGMLYSMDMLPAHLYRDEEIIDNLNDGRVADITTRYTDEAINFVRNNRMKPFFLYFSHTIPHPPLLIPKEAQTPGRPVYEDAIEYMDRETGRLLRAVEDLGLRENTLVFFSSDNGPMHPSGQAGAFKGRIRDAYEGGVRVPLIASWPGKLPAGRVERRPAIAYDVFPTLLKLAGGQLPNDREYDGQDMWPLLSGQGEFRREKPFYWVYGDRVTTIRDGRWKLHVASREKVLPRPELYDMENDPAEEKSVADQNPEVLKTLLSRIHGFQAIVPKVWRLDYPVRDPKKLPSGARRK